MNADDFEQRLKRQPIRALPPEWRQEILAAVRTVRTKEAMSRPAILGFATLYRRFSGLLWPSPRAWAALTTVWIALLVFNYGLGGAPTAATAGAAGPEVLAARKEQERLLTELIGPTALPNAKAPVPDPIHPRSETRAPFLKA